MEIKEKYNMLLCLEYKYTNDKHYKVYSFMCDCGKQVEYVGSYVKLGRYKSCGCQKYQKNKDEDILNTKYNRLKPIKRVENIYGGKAFLCICDCGNESVVSLGDLKNNKTKSCGCLAKEKSSDNIKKYSTTHGRHGTPEYRVWRGMRTRCYYENTPQYKNYGGRGIKVCNRWKESFENFYEDMGDKPTPKHQLDRIDNDGNYEPNNCRWVTPSENALNKEHKSGTLGIKNVYKDSDSYYTQVKRQGKTRVSSYTTLENALKLKEIYITEYKKDKDKWLKDTINKTYLKTLNQH